MKHWLPEEVIQERIKLLDEIIGILTNSIATMRKGRVTRSSDEGKTRDTECRPNRVKKLPFSFPRHPTLGTRHDTDPRHFRNLTPDTRRSICSPLAPDTRHPTLFCFPTPTIHVVDDDPSFRTALTRLLRAAKYEVRGYSSASEFLNSDPCPGPGCILLDLQMPGVSGLDLQESLARMEERLPIIFLTGHGDIPASVRA